MLRILKNTLLKRVRLLVVIGAAGALGGIASLVGTNQITPPVTPLADNTPGQEAAWGDALLTNIELLATTLSPIKVANACGLGASSCFRCHNGRRAALPATGDKTGLWHKQHESVNYSCAGCHKGNPRLMKKKIAHSRLIADPRTNPGDTCLNCHTSGDAQKLIDRYLQLSSKGE